MFINFKIILKIFLQFCSILVFCIMTVCNLPNKVLDCTGVHTHARTHAQRRGVITLKTTKLIVIVICTHTSGEHKNILVRPS
jgi:hypothetical protein